MRPTPRSRHTGTSFWDHLKYPGQVVVTDLAQDFYRPPCRLTVERTQRGWDSQAVCGPPTRPNAWTVLTVATVPALREHRPSLVNAPGASSSAVVIRIYRVSVAIAERRSNAHTGLCTAAATIGKTASEDLLSSMKQLLQVAIHDGTKLDQPTTRSSSNSCSCISPQQHTLASRVIGWPRNCLHACQQDGPICLVTDHNSCADEYVSKWHDNSFMQAHLHDEMTVACRVGRAARSDYIKQTLVAKYVALNIFVTSGLVAWSV